MIHACTSRNVVYLERWNFNRSENDVVMLEICDHPRCAKMFAYCEHVNNTWNEQQDMLTCDLCGADVT